MKAWFAAGVGLVFLGSPALAQDFDRPVAKGRGLSRHPMKRTMRPAPKGGTFNVVVGSDIKITPYGEVIVPPTTIIAVDERMIAPPSERRPDKGRPAALPLDPKTPPSVPAQP